MSEGGTEWEARMAWELITNARLSGDSAAEQIGWQRLYDAFRNKMVGALSDQLVPMLQEVRGMRSERETDARSFDHKLDLLMTLAEGGQALLGKFEARLALLESQQIEDMTLIRGKLRSLRDDVSAMAHENIQDKLGRDDRIALTDGLRAMLARWPEVERLLDGHAE